MTLELITMQDEQRGMSRSHTKAQATPTKTEPRSHTSPGDFDSVKEAVDSYRTILLNGSADASASLWDEAASVLVYVTADDGEVHKGFYEVRNALRTQAARYEYVTHDLIDQGIDLYGTLACAFYKIRFERHEKGVDREVPGTLTATLVLKKTGDAWKIVQAHESAVTTRRR